MFLRCHDEEHALETSPARRVETVGLAVLATMRPEGCTAIRGWVPVEAG